MLRITAYIFGVFFLLLGIWGLIPIIAPNDMVMVYFRVNAIHNLYHLAIGIIALTVGSIGIYASLLFFRIFCIVNFLNVIVGYYAGNHVILGIIENNTADIVLHLVAGIISLYFGFFFTQSEVD